MLSFNKSYGSMAAILFLVEVLIALFVRDHFIRPYFGDVLVVLLLYCFVRTFLTLSVWPLAFGVLLFSFMIELFQYMNLIEMVGLDKSTLARTVLGTSFAWEDLLAYVAGYSIILIAEKWWSHKQPV